MNTPARTKGPWDYFVGNANGRGLIRIEAHCDSVEAGKHIASMPRGADSEANASFIVLACNSHYSLVEAITELLATHPAAYRDANKIDNRTDNAVKIAKAALAAVTIG